MVESATYETASGMCYHDTYTKAVVFHHFRFPVVLDDMPIWFSDGRVFWESNGTNSRGMQMMKRVFELTPNANRHDL